AARLLQPGVTVTFRRNASIWGKAFGQRRREGPRPRALSPPLPHAAAHAAAFKYPKRRRLGCRLSGRGDIGACDAAGPLCIVLQEEGACLVDEFLARDAPF